MRIPLLTLALLAAPLAGCGSDEEVLEPTVPPVEGGSEDLDNAPSLTVGDQPVVDGEVTLDEVRVESDAWVVLHRAGPDGAPGDVVGVSFVMHGETSPVPVQLDAPVAEGERLVAMLHDDTGDLGTYQFGGPGGFDQPLMENGAPVTEAFVIR